MPQNLKNTEEHKILEFKFFFLCEILSFDVFVAKKLFGKD